MKTEIVVRLKEQKELMGYIASVLVHTIQTFRKDNVFIGYREKCMK